MRRLLTSIVILSAMLPPQGVRADEKALTVGILCWSRTPYNVEAIEGFQKAFDLGKVPHTYNVEDARGDETTAREALLRWKQQKVDLIFAVGTEASLLAVKENQETPVIFIAPPHSGLVRTSDGPTTLGPNATGGSTHVDMADSLRLFLECLPAVKRLGVIYDPSATVAATEVAEARTAARTLGITLDEATVTKADDIPSALEKLLEAKIDALWVPTDPLMLASLSRIDTMARPRKLPLVTSAPEGMAPAQGDSVVLTAVAADYGELGRLSAQTALDILTSGARPADIPIRDKSPHVIIVNSDVAARLDYAVPPPFLAKAHVVLRAYEGQKISVAGTGDSQDLLRAVAKALLTKTEGAAIEIPESVGSSGGIRALLAGKADLARVARKLKPEEAAAGLVCEDFALAPVVFVVHPSVTGIDNVTYADIVGIYSGKMAKWEALGAKEGRIYAVTRESGDACLIVLNTTVPGLADIVEPRAKVINNSPEARDALVGHRNTFGFLAMSVASGTNLRILKVEGVYPTADNVRSGAYKLVVPLGIVYRQELTGLARRFVDFLFSKDGQAIIAEMGAVPVGAEDK